MSLLLLTLASSLLAVAVASAEQVSAVDLVRNPTPYRNRVFPMRGTMLNPRPATIGDLAVPTATVFELSASPALLKVLATVQGARARSRESPCRRRPDAPAPDTAWPS